MAVKLQTLPTGVRVRGCYGSQQSSEYANEITVYANSQKGARAQEGEGKEGNEEEEAKEEEEEVKEAVSYTHLTLPTNIAV